MTQNGYRQRVVRSCRLMERLHRHVNANARQKNWFDRATASYVIIAQHSLVAATFSIDDLVISFITLKVDYRLLQCCSGRSTTWTECDLDRVQSAVNAAARLTAGARKYDHVTPLLKDLHWLRVQQRVQYKLCVLVHPCLNGTATRCMNDLTASLGSIPVVVCTGCHLPNLSCHPHVAQLSAIERSPSLVREPGTVYRLLSSFALYIAQYVQKTSEIIPVWTICDDVHSDYLAL